MQYFEYLPSQSLDDISDESFDKIVGSANEPSPKKSNRKSLYNCLIDILPLLENTLLSSQSDSLISSRIYRPVFQHPERLSYNTLAKPFCAFFTICHKWA